MSFVFFVCFFCLLTFWHKSWSVFVGLFFNPAIFEKIWILFCNQSKVKTRSLRAETHHERHLVQRLLFSGEGGESLVWRMMADDMKHRVQANEL